MKSQRLLVSVATTVILLLGLPPGRQPPKRRMARLPAPQAWP